MLSSAESTYVGMHREEDARAVLARRVPGESLHPMLKLRAIGVARVLPSGVIPNDPLNVDELKRLAAGIRRIGEVDQRRAERNCGISPTRRAPAIHRFEEDS
ncbi:hypothetical protein [Actinoplanes sp. NPDC051859]|uniref:hypothetical protein n=1 Tax=Actinoplanes sp. NPDC051859 TaxID=3363909 RepID=UPI0037A940DB